MPLRERGGKWHYRFWAAGRWWTGSTELAATKRNEADAQTTEADARKLVKAGRSAEIKLTPKAFNEAADQFIEWAKGEHRAKPNTWKRLRGSMTALKTFFGARPLHTITAGEVEDYKSWRRTGDDRLEIPPVAEVSIRHDLHALGPLFRYGKKHRWCTVNPVEEVKIPSDLDALTDACRNGSRGVAVLRSGETVPRNTRHRALNDPAGSAPIGNDGGARR
jgi:hypothetical protein